MLYDHLFYNSYKALKKSGNFDDDPLTAGILAVEIVFILNAWTLICLADAFVKYGQFAFDGKIYAYLTATIVCLLLMLYYGYGGRYRKVISKYEEQEKNRGKSVPSIIILILYYCLSTICLLLAAMYKNGDGIFAP